MKKLMMTLALAMTMSMAANAQVNPTGCQQKKECCKKQGDKKQCDKKAGTCCKKQEKK